MPQLNPLDWGPQLIWLLITFGVLYLLMIWIALPRIGSVIEKRADHIAGDLQSAEKFRRETEEAIAAYEQALAEAKQKAHAIVEEGRAKLKAEVDAEQAKLAKELSAKSDEAEARIEKAKTAAMKEVNAVAIDVATDIVNKLTGVAASKDDIEKAVVAARKA
jgi:F-type H+-transporting ATPase subunit b